MSRRLVFWGTNLIGAIPLVLSLARSFGYPMTIAQYDAINALCLAIVALPIGYRTVVNGKP